MDGVVELEEALSFERFGRYLGWAGGDRVRAVELYTLNTRASERLYTPLQMLEVALRNRIHSVMAKTLSENWFQEPGVLLLPIRAVQLRNALDDIARERKEPSPCRIVAALTFSFWTSMFSPEYEILWQKKLHRIGVRPNGKGLRRKDFSGSLSPIRTLRNRIAHHEPIIMWDLRKHYGKIIEITEWLSPAAAEWCHENCTFLDVFPQERIALHIDKV